MRALVIAAMVALAAPAAADPPDGEIDARALVLNCVNAAGVIESAVRACQGIAAQPCHNVSVTTHDMVMCAAREGEAWDEVVTASLSRLRAAQPDLADALNAAQDDWRAHRDSECGYRVARWGEGSGARVVFAGCLAQMNADRAADLIAYEQEGQ